MWKIISMKIKVNDSREWDKVFLELINTIKR